MDIFLTTIVSPFYLLFGSWNFFTMCIVGVIALGIICVLIDIILKR